MRNKSFITVMILTGMLIILGCTKSSGHKEEVPETAQNNQVKVSTLSSEYLGNYHGIQKSYNMKNKFGDDMIIGGKKVKVPSIDYKFLLKENGVASLQQTGLDDNTRVYYEGTARIKEENATTLVVECSLSDGESSKPTYILKINKSKKNGICTGTNEPEFKVEKVK